MRDMPRYSPFRPHFMAPGPDVEIIEDKPNFDEQLSNQRKADDEEGPPTYQYYRSNKILGKLFDAVDEKQIFAGVKQVTREASTRSSSHRSDSVLLRVILRDLGNKTKNIDWKVQLISAKGIRDE